MRPLLGVLLALLLAAPAQAATVSVRTDPDPSYPLLSTTTFTVAGDQAANALKVRREGNDLVVTDDLVDLTAGERCAQESPRTVRCANVSSVDRAVVDGAGGDDTIEVDVSGFSIAESLSIAGGTGNDTLRGNPRSAYVFDSVQALEGGDGNDTMIGGAGADLLHGGAGDDSLDGGGGSDTASYADAETPVTVDLAAGVGGVAGERDTLRVENVLGGSGADRLSGDERPNELTGGLGRDRLSGRAGADTLRSGTRVTCGAGRDFVWSSSGFGRDCERYALGNRFDPAPGLFPARIRPGRIALPIDCDPDRRCRLRVDILDARGRTLGRRRYARFAGGTRVWVPLTQRGRAAVRRGLTRLTFEVLIKQADFQDEGSWTVRLP